MDLTRNNALACPAAKMVRPISLLLLSCAALSVSCRKAETPLPTRAENSSSSAVAVVAGAEISAEAVRAELRRRFRGLPEGGWTTEQKQEALERLLRNEAIYARARASGFDQSAEIQARIKSLVIAQFRERRFTNAAPAVSEEELEAACGAPHGRFSPAASVRGAVIFLASPRTATAALKAATRRRAEAILEEARAAADERAFAQVVARHSEDQATRYRGGDLGWLTREGVGGDPALAEALFALNRPGEFAPVVEAAQGFYVARLLDRREAGRRPPAEMREAVRHQLARQKAEQAERDFFAAMKSGLDIQINHALLDSISVPAERNEPPRLPGATTVQVQQ